MGQNKIEDIGPVQERKWRDGFLQWGDSITQVAQKEQAKASDWIGAAAKTILGTNTDILTNLVSGVVGWGEDVVDAGASLAGMLTETFGWDRATQNIRDFVTKDLYDEQEITRNLFKTGALTNAFAATNPGLAFAIPTMFTIEEWLNPTKSVDDGFGGIENIKDDNSVLGETSKGILQSAGETLAKQGIQMSTGIPVGDIITGVTVFGSQAEQALKEDANFMQAGGSGLISAAAEIMFEKLSGGIKISGHTLDEGLTKLMSRSISNVALRNFLNFAKDIGGEAIEEAATEFVGKLGTFLYKDRDQWDEILFSKDALVDYIQSAISGGLMGGAFNAANAVNSTKKGVDYKSGLTNDEQKVVDKVTENAIKQKETDGKKLSAKEKNLLYNDILKQLEDGDISIADIEDALGEEVFKDYADTIKYEEDILKQYEELGKKKNYTLAEASLFEELKSQKKDIEQNSPREELKKQMSDKVFERVKDSKLMNSYANEARRGETFKADVNEYDEAERATIQSAIDAGFLNNTNKTRRFVNWVAKIAAKTGIKVDFTTIEKLKESGFAVDGKFVNGYKTKDGIGINMQSKKILETVVGHEITHVLEGTELYNEMQKALFDYAKSKGELETRRKAMKELYKNMDADIDSELTAELVGDYLFTDQEFINRLANDNRNLFQKVWDEVKYMWKQAHPSSPEAQKLEKLKRAFEEAYKASGEVKKTGGDTQFSLSEIIGESGKNYGIGVYLDSTLLTNLTDAERIKMVKEYVKELGGRVFTAYDNNNNAVDVHIVEYEEKFKNKQGKRVPVNKDLSNKQIKFKTKQEAIALVDELVITAKFDDHKPSAYPHDWVDNYGNNDWEYWTTHILDKENTIWEATLNIATSANGEKILYDINPIKKVEQSITLDTSTTNPIIPQKSDLSSGSAKNSAENDISVLEGGSVTKFSLSTWTPETQKRVKNDLVKSGFDSAQVDKWIADTNSVAAVIAADKDRLDFEAADNQVMLKDNQEYIKTLDASTLCAKRLVYQGTFDAIQHRLPNTVLTSDDLIDLLNMMKEKGVQTPCGVCYVESRRRHLGKFAKEWLDGYNGEYKPNLDEVTTSDGLETLRKTHPQTYKDFVDAMNKKGSSNPKVVQLRTEYRNEIMSLTPAQIRKIEAIGGLRVQSFSDFETPHMLDMMQAVMDMSAKGLHSQAYTKVPNFAWVFGDTGIKINLSLIAEGDGFDADGNLAFSSTEGMAIEDAMALRDAYSSNVGTIIVGANDKHILACMADDRIDFIIPFHRSGWGKNELDMMGMSSYTDYTYGQKEHDLATGKGVANLYPPDYWDYSVSGKQNAEKYLSLCAKLGREPKFSQFLVNNGDGSYSLQSDGSTDGYWKTLIDFKMYDNNGVGAAQQTVQPNFNMNEAYRVLNEYEGGANKLPVAKEIVDEFVKKKEGVKFSLSEGTTEGESTRSQDVMVEDVAPYDGYYDQSRMDSLLGNDSTSEPNKRVQTVQDRLSEKIKNTKAELENDKRLRQESIDDYDFEIERLQSEYDAKRNKTTRAANDILRRIERLQRIKGNVDADYAKRISDLEKKVENMSKPEYRIAAQRMAKQEEYTTKMKELVGDTSTWTDKKLGVFYKTNTLRRNLRDIVRDANGNRDIAKADAIYEEIQGKYSHNEALLNKESNKVKKPYADMNITKAEDAYIQMLGELRYNPDTTLTEDVVNKYYEENKSKIDVEKVNKAIEMARKTYDDLLVRVNEVLREQGMKEIPYRQGYFPHFTEDKQGILAKILNWKTQNTDIPTDIAGITEQFNPDRSWQSFNKQRTTDTTDYSFTKGLDSYVQGALDWIYHIEDIQKRRALENYIRYTHSDQGIKDKIDAIRKNETYNADEMQAQIDLVYKEAKNPLNNFVTDLRAGTNRLANKKSSLDRTVEEMTNRKIYSTMTNISNRVTGNMVAGSVSSALTNFIPITQSWGQVSPVSSLKAMGDTIKSIAKDDGTIAKSDFLTNRLNKAENLYKTTWDKVGDTLGSLMEVIDNFTAQTVWRSKYIENMSNGMSEAEAIKNADQFAANVMASRSRGETPTIFDSKNPLIKTLTAFQLEVNNQYGYMFKDMPQDIGTDAKGKLAKGYVAMFLGAYAYNALYSSLTGRDSAFDPVGIIMDLLNDLFGDDEEEPVDALMNFGENVVEELPFIGGLAGGGRIPISSALPYDGLGAAITGTIEDVSEENWKSLTKEWLNPLYYLVMPMGGGQLKKSIEGLYMYSPEHPIAGSYTDSGNLRFPVEEDLASVAQAAVFGQWANKNARTYLDEDIAPLNEKQIQEYVDSGLTIEEYWDYREGLKKFSTKEQKIKYINGLDIEEWQKSVLISYLSKNNSSTSNKSNSSTSQKTISSSQYDKAMELLDDFNNRFGNN